MSADKTVPLTLPLTVWGRLASLADKQGIRVEDVIANALIDLVPIKPLSRIEQLSQELTEAKASGFRIPRR